MSQGRIPFYRAAVLSLAFVLSSGLVNAGDDHGHGHGHGHGQKDGHGHDHGHHVEAGAHEHGRGSLDIVVEGNLVLAELRVPSFDILGFEHAAKTDAEKKTASAAREVLAKPLALLGPSGDANCAVTSMSVEFGGEKSATGKKDKHGHDHSHDAHDHGDKHAENNDSGHSDVRASYTLNCAVAPKLETLSLTYFGSFKNAQSLTVNIVSPNGQFSQEVTRAEPVIGITRGGS